MHQSSLHDPKGVARLFVRIGFGLSLAFVGFTHYQDAGYAASVGQGLGVLGPIGMVWGYVLPGLMIVGGLLLAFGIYMQIAAYLSALALASIPAGLMLKSAIAGVPLEDTMPPAMNAFVWLLVLMVAVKSSCCSSQAPACCGSCDCGPESKSAMKPVVPMKAAPIAPISPVKSPVSAPAKKIIAKKPSAKKPASKKAL